MLLKHTKVCVKYMRRLFYISILTVLFSQYSLAQYYVNGQDPFSIKWKKIETLHFKLIFSEDISSLGKIYAGSFEEVYKTGGVTLGHSPRKIPIIIHNKNVLSNGEVAWAPRRMNLYTIGSQSGNSQPYTQQLVLHEFRHVVQIDKLNTSNTRLLYYLFGEQAIGASLGWHVPLWFLEGDAVVYETGASNDGRGRVPDFTMKLKAQVSKYGVYSYPKAQFGSYRNFVPNHYELGYQLTSIARHKYGADIWDQVLAKVAKSPISANAFSKGIVNVTGLPERKLYDESMDTFTEKICDVKCNDAKHPKDYVNYYSPYIFGESVISYKTSYDNIPSIVTTDKNGNDKIVITTGYIYDQTFSYNDSVLVWNELKRTRWENDNFNRIVSYNIKTKKKRYLTRKSKAYYSIISPDNSKVLSVEVDERLLWSITIRDAYTGIKIDSIIFNNDQPVQPSWSPNMDEVVFMKIGKSGKSLNIINLHSHQVTEIIPSSYTDMSYPLHLGNAIVIKSVNNSVSNHLKYDLILKQWSAITDEQYGVGEGRFSDNRFVYTTYTPDGYKLINAFRDSLCNKQIEPPKVLDTDIVKQLALDEHKVDFSIIDTVYEVEHYSRFKNLVNIHSWAPIGVNMQNINVGPGVTLMSQNDLSTSVFAGGYLYNLTDESHRYFIDYSYNGFYPLINSKFATTYYAREELDNVGNIHSLDYNELSFYTGITAPLNFDRGKWIRRMQPNVAYEYMDVTVFEKDIELLSIKAHSFSYRLYFYNLRATSYRDMQSRWGQKFSFNYMSSPFNTNQLGKLASGETWLYFPGVLKTHGLQFYGGFQLKEYGDYSYTDAVLYPYGYQRIDNTKMVSAMAYYKFPVLYPDLNVFEFVYVKRLKSTLFYQYSQFDYNSIKTEFISTGVDLTADVHIFRFPFPFELGVRYARRLRFGDNYFQFLIDMSF